MSKYLFALLILSLFISSCGDDDGLDIAAPLLPYFESFKAEAAERGIDVDYEALGISGFIGGISSQGVIGQCNPENNAVTIDRIFWASFDEDGKELIVYHELGHCVLKRQHCDKINPDQTCHSIMHSSEDLCDNNYNQSTREEFIDELFDPFYFDECN